jgi:hypothetical protein
MDYLGLGIFHYRHLIGVVLMYAKVKRLRKPISVKVSFNIRSFL